MVATYKKTLFMDVQEILYIVGGIGGSGALGWFIKQATDRVRSESTDKEHTRLLKELVDAKNLQLRNNELQQKSIDNVLSKQIIFEDRMLDRRKEFEEYKKEATLGFKEYKALQHAENTKVNKALSENTNAIASLDATMKGLDSVLQMLFKQMSN